MRCYAILLVLAIVCSAVLAHHGNDPYRPNHMRPRHNSHSHSHERSPYPRNRYPPRRHSHSSSESREHDRSLPYPKKPVYAPNKY